MDSWSIDGSDVFDDRAFAEDGGAGDALIERQMTQGVKFILELEFSGGLGFWNECSVAEAGPVSHHVSQHEGRLIDSGDLDGAVEGRCRDVGEVDRDEDSAELGNVDRSLQNGERVGGHTSTSG